MLADRRGSTGRLERRCRVGVLAVGLLAGGLGRVLDCASIVRLLQSALLCKCQIIRRSNRPW